MPAVYVRKDVELPVRRGYDLYPTDLPTVRDGLDVVSRGGFSPDTILDPGAGEGIWGEQACLRWSGALITGVEIRDIRTPRSYATWVIGDFLDPEEPRSWRFDLVMGNPPYGSGEAFVRRGLRLLNPGGRLIYLMKLSFLAGQRRERGLYREFPLKWVAPCARRPSFTPDGKTAPEEYAFFCWEAGYRGPEQIMRVR